MITIQSIDLLDCGADVICQQVNCKGVMGSGLARQIRLSYPIVYEKYSAFCAHYPNGKALLASVLYVVLPSFTVANLFAQVSYGRTGLHTDYLALRECLCKVRNHYADGSATIGIPYGIGCGLGGGDWSIVEQIIMDVFDGYLGKVIICKKGA